MGVGEVRDLEQVDIDDNIESGEPALHQDGALFLVQSGVILDDLPLAFPAIHLGIEDHMVASLIVDHKILQLRLLCLGPMQLKARLFDSCEVHVDIECADMIQHFFVGLAQILLAHLMVGLEGLALVDLQDVLHVGSLMALLLMESLD